MVKRMVLVSLVTFAIVAGCGSDDDNVTGKAEVLGKGSAALSAASVTSVVGTYGANCKGRSGSWTIDLTGSPTPPADALSVRKNDKSCVLTVTRILTATGNYLGAPPIVMDTADTYKPAASAFSSGGTFAFYGNAKIDTTEYKNNFLVTVTVSDDPLAKDDGTKNANQATVYGSASVLTVPAPNYTVAWDNLVFAQDADGVVDSATGYAQLVSGGIDGSPYVVVNGAVGSTVTAIEAAFNAATVSGTITSDPESLKIPAASFALVGATLPVTRTVIVRRLQDAVSSYETIRVTFAP